MYPQKIFILGVPVTNATSKEVLNSIQEAVELRTQCTVFTPNPEMVVESKKNRAFANALVDAQICLPDGYGLFLAAKYLGVKIVQRITGTDFFLELIGEAEKKSWSVFLLGGVDQTPQEITDVLLKKYPKLHIVGARTGGHIDNFGHGDMDEATVTAINASGAEVVFVAFGAPKQELWISQHRLSMPNAFVFMSVGGAFDFVTGKARRAPKWVRRIGLEWFYRLLCQPWRIIRIIKATVVFTIQVLRNK